MDHKELASFLVEKAIQYATKSFIEDDPIQIPHRFTSKEDIEISGLFGAILSWGNRKTIIAKSMELMARMDQDPGNFVKEATARDLKAFEGFKHRTFQDIDVQGIVMGLQALYVEYRSIGQFFAAHLTPHNQDLGPAFHAFKKFLLTNGLPARAAKHFGDPEGGSACKRIVMYSRWMARPNTEGIDFGLWKDVSPKRLSLPLDVHSGRVARSLGLIERKQNDWKAVQELDTRIRAILPNDPAKLDYALFGLGVYEGWT